MREVLRVSPVAVLVLCAMACGGGNGAPANTAAAVTETGPRTIDVVRVVEQPLDVELSLPGELTAFQAVAIYPRVTGFVKTVNVDRGSRVRAGEVLATLEAPELIAQRRSQLTEIGIVEKDAAF